MKRILLALLCVIALGAVGPDTAPAEQEVAPLKLVIDSGMSAQRQNTLINLFVWINEHMPEQIEDGVREHQISVFILDFDGNGIAGADWDREGDEPYYKIAVDPDFFTHVPLADQKSILIHELEHLNLYAQGHQGERTPCNRAFHEQEALGAEVQYALHTGITNTSRLRFAQVELEYAKAFLSVKCAAR